MADQKMKQDAGKVRVELVDPTFIRGIARVLTHGAIKYAPNRWRRGIAFSRLIGGALRHILAFAMGEDNDPDTGEPHMYHAACNLMFLASFVRNEDLYPAELDDRIVEREESVSFNYGG